ncbi:Uncharacterised protein [Mycobacteroides abscessus subsp. abscessus]|nr:Uncharacterised protein [Mycobacteroides abscessus subsp. abscessus]
MINKITTPGNAQVSRAKPDQAISSPRYAGLVTNRNPPPNGMRYSAAPGFFLSRRLRTIDSELSSSVNPHR